MDSSPLLPLPTSSSHSSSASLVGVVDYCGKPASRSSSGRWTAALFIIGVEIAERFAYYGISSNLITYLTGPLRESTVEAAVAVNTWSGVASMLPLAGAFVADSYLGRYRTILFASMLYILGLGLLTLSSVLPSLYPPKCSVSDVGTCAPNNFQVGFFYFAIYLVALAQGGHKPCTQAFGADQFDENDPQESISRSSFFNWWYASLCLGSAVTIILLNYVQDNISWALGFGIPLVSMGLALILFLLGTKMYRFYQLEGESPFLRIGKSFVTLVKKRMAPSHGLTGSQTSTSDAEGGLGHVEFEKDEAADTIRLEEAKGVLRLVPIWATCLIYGVVFAQSSTFFTKQGSTLDRRIGSNFQVPPAALQSFIGISIVAFIPVYDRILVPVTRKFTKIPTGITQLQRIGAGMMLSLISMGIAGLVEVKRLKTAKDYGLIDQPKTPIPMSLWWLVPQYILYGIADVFTMVGLQEFFYDQVPDALRSLGLALYLSIFGIGNFISSFLIAFINKTSSRSGASWFSDNLNRAHLDYFYWLLAGLSAAELILYLYFARDYAYKKKQNAAL
ncbi:putative peptide/nitrate transporter [Platanthera zijinensis]|uniref:Peptide/nitrate transporter n=1 Tax=Platanthera zijinensis TaxID=2320716 RepID=A0AAP0B5C9_9ASPA